MRTVLFSFVLSNAICAAVVVAMWATNRKRYTGLGLWVVDYLMQFAAVLLLALRGVIPAPASILLGGPLVAAGAFLLLRGLQRYTGAAGRQWHNYLLLSVSVAVHGYFSLVHESLLARDLNFSATLLALCGQSAWLMLYRVDAGMRRNTRLAGITFVAFSLFSLLRIAGELVAPPNEFLAVGTIGVVVVQTYQMLTIGLTFSLLLMVSRGLFADLDRDIAQRKLVEEALRDAREAADRANQAKSEFLARLSHELRTPLTPVLLAVGQWEGKADLPAAMREDVAMVRRNVDLEARLLDDLLDVNRIVYGKMPLRREPTDLHERIATALDIVKSDVSAKQLGLTVQLKAERYGIDGDPARLLQAIWNPLRNAIKFTPGGGRITVSTDNDSDGRVRVQIADTGMGIEPERVARLFQPFEQGGQCDANGSGGLGLGLTICRSLVELHGGSVTAHSDGPGRGTIITIQLPTVAQPYAGQPNCTPPAPTRSETHTARILLVEDHSDTAQLLSRVLKSWGHQVRVAHSVTEASAAAAAAPFDLLISDLGLPDGSGHDLMRQLSAARTIKAIAVSGYGMDEDQARSRDVGFAMHLTKPVNLAEFRAAIEAVLNDDAPPASGGAGAGS